MILADDEPKLDMAASPDRKVDDSGLPIEFVRLVLCFHEQTLDIGYPAGDAFPNALAVVLEDATSHFER